MSKYSGSSLVTGIYSGLYNTYSVLAQAYPNGVTVDSINEAKTKPAVASQLNPTFASYLQSNFSSMDKDGDGVISASEMSNVANQMSMQGLTREQLAQLGTSSGMSTDTLSTVLNHFDQIDKNKDGKVTSSEISAYNVESSKEKKQLEFSNRAATNISIFYGDESSSTDTSSLLDYKYLSDKEVL